MLRHTGIALAIGLLAAQPSIGLAEPTDRGAGGDRQRGGESVEWQTRREARTPSTAIEQPRGSYQSGAGHQQRIQRREMKRERRGYGQGAGMGRGMGAGKGAGQGMGRGQGRR